MPDRVLLDVDRGGGVSIATEAVGEAHEGTILLVMGATASMVWWPDELLDALAAGGNRVIRFDHRDTGASTTNPPGQVRYDLADLAADLLAILDAYRIDAAHLVGMSLGGYVAQIDALTHPQRVRSLTLIAAEPLGLPYPSEGIAPEFLEHFGKMGELDWSDHRAVADFMLRIAQLSAGSAEPFDAAAVQRRITRELERTGSMQSAFNHSALAGELDPGLKASDLQQPLLLIHGSEDPIISVEAAKVTAAAVPNAELLILDRRGHELLARDIHAIAGAILRNCARAG